jgi:hypothetical protein
VGVGAAHGRARARLGLGERDLEHEPAGGARGQEVLDRVRALAAGAGRADLRVERQQRRLQVAARGLRARRRAQVAPERRLPADLDVGQAARTGPERLDRVVELGDRRRRADRRAALFAAHARQPGAADEQRPPRAQPAVGDLGHDDRPARDDGHVGPVRKSADRLLARRRDDHFRRLNDPHNALSLRPRTRDEGSYT